MDFEKIITFVGGIILLCMIVRCSETETGCNKKGGALVRGVWGYECIQRVK